MERQTLSEIHAAEVSSADQEKARSVARAEYLLDVFVEHEATLREAYPVPEDWETRQASFFLYARLKEAVQNLEEALAAEYQPTQYKHPDELCVEPLVTLKWVQYAEMEGGEVTYDGRRPYFWEPTDAGRAIISGLREAQGLEPLGQLLEVDTSH